MLKAKSILAGAALALTLGGGALAAEACCNMPCCEKGKDCCEEKAADKVPAPAPAPAHQHGS